MQLYLIRHGESISNNTGVHGAPQDLLSEYGRTQAESLARRFKGIPIDLIISSTYRRAQETAEIVNAHLKKPIESSDLITERRSPSEIWGRPASDPPVIKVMEEMYTHYITGGRYSDEESFDDLKKRSRSFLGEILKKHEKRILVVTHGIFLRYLVGYMMFGEEFTGRDFIKMRDFMRTKNTGITICKYEASPKPYGTPGWKLETWNDHTHLS